MSNHAQKYHQCNGEKDLIVPVKNCREKIIKRILVDLPACKHASV